MLVPRALRSRLNVPPGAPLRRTRRASEHNGFKTNGSSHLKPRGGKRWRASEHNGINPTDLIPEASRRQRGERASSAQKSPRRLTTLQRKYDGKIKEEVTVVAPREGQERLGEIAGCSGPKTRHPPTRAPRPSGLLCHTRTHRGGGGGRGAFWLRTAPPPGHSRLPPGATTINARGKRWWVANSRHSVVNARTTQPKLRVQH